MSVWIAETLIATTLLMALVMMLRRPVAHWLGAGAAYMLWLLPLARMMLPALPQTIADPSPLHRAVDQSGLPAMLEPGRATVTLAATPAFPWIESAIALWLAGVALFLVVQLVGYARFRRHMLAGATPVARDGRIRIVSSAQATGPLAFGVLRPYIVLPADFALRFDPQEQAMALAHERAHHDRGDLAANMVALLLLAAHWCNPVAWLAYRAYRADQETACDARVLSRHGRDLAHAYGRAILKAAGGRHYAGACHLTRLATLKGRLKMLSTHDTSLRRISWGMAAVAIVTASGLALTASGSRAAQEMAALTDRVGAADFGRLATLVAEPARATVPQTPDVPASPSAPAAPAGRADLSAVPSTTPVIAPDAPQAPAVSTADMVPPVPPVPPVTVRSDQGRISVTHADGRVERYSVPTEGEIARMVPIVDVREGCDGDRVSSQRETVGADGRRRISVRICERAIAAQARAAERQALQAERLALQAERQARVGERARLLAARARIAASRIPADDRAEALRDIDQDIAELDRGD